MARTESVESALGTTAPDFTVRIQHILRGSMLINLGIGSEKNEQIDLRSGLLPSECIMLCAPSALGADVHMPIHVALSTMQQSQLAGKADGFNPAQRTPTRHLHCMRWQ